MLSRILLASFITRLCWDLREPGTRRPRFPS
jgi:hypothetical protein